MTILLFVIQIKTDTVAREKSRMYIKMYINGFYPHSSISNPQPLLLLAFKNSKVIVFTLGIRRLMKNK